MGIAPEGVDGLELKWGQLAIDGERFGEIGLGDIREDMGDMKYKGVGRGNSKLANTGSMALVAASTMTLMARPSCVMKYTNHSN